MMQKEFRSGELFSILQWFEEFVVFAGGGRGGGSITKTIDSLSTKRKSGQYVT